MSLWSICAFSCWVLFCRIDISRLPCVRVKTHSADHLPQWYCNNNFVRRWTGRHLAIHLETGPTVLPFGSGRSNRISMSDLSFTRKRVPSRAATRMTRKYWCLLVQASSKLRRVYDRMSMRDQCGGKKGLLISRALAFRSGVGHWKI